MKMKSMFQINHIVVVALAALAPLASSPAAGETHDPFHSLGYLIGEQNTTSDLSTEGTRLARGVEGPIKSVAAVAEDTAMQGDDNAVAAMPTAPTPSYDPDDRNNPPQP